MTSPSDSSPVATELQFERAEQQDGMGAPCDQGLVCSRCQRPITTEYYQVGGAVACGDCKAAVVQEQEAAAARGRRASGFARGALFGLGAAIAGAAIYYAVIAITEWELAIVALLIGWMVGWAVRRGSRGAGGRRYQVAATALTYFSVGLAYTPVAFKALMDAQKKGVATGAAVVKPRSTVPTAATTTSSAPTSTTTAAPALTPTSVPTSAAADDGEAASSSPRSAAAEGAGAKGARPPRGPVPWAAIAVALLAAVVASLVLPVLVVVGTLPSGLLSAVIIGVGMRQAWKMTAAMAVPVSGPYQVGTPLGTGQA